jgi:hypothetical protein
MRLNPALKTVAAAAALALAAGAQAQVFGPASTIDAASGRAQATRLAWTESVGHQLITPYFSTQGDNNTLLSLVNTDDINGKLVKLRFRGAANGDALLDFMVMLAPNDMWTASLSKGEDGITRLTSPDNSCTLPGSLKDATFHTDRLQADLTAEVKAANTREGLVEAINMADVPPGGALLRAIMPRNGVPTCDAATVAVLSQPGAIASEEQAVAAGLAPPTGGLTGNWQIIRLSNYASFSGRQQAVAALDDQGRRAVANWAFSPQSSEDAGRQPLGQTTDPVLQAHGAAWSDLPDLSTPLAGDSAQAQIESQHSRSGTPFAHVTNEFVRTADTASVPAATDWVVSQPLLRYVAAVDPADGKLLTLPGLGESSLGVNERPSGKVACTASTFTGRNREATGGGISFTMPPTLICGVAAVVNFNSEREGDSPSKVLQAALDPHDLGHDNPRYADRQPILAGWGSLTLHAQGQDLQAGPVLGFSATSLRNVEQNGNYGSVVQHAIIKN